MYSFRTNGNYIDFVNTDATSLAVETVVKSLHNTSRCVDWSLPEDTTRISFTIDEDKYNNLLITDIDFDGVAMDSQDDFETGITAMFTGLAGGSPGGSSYLVYTAIIGQSGTNPPSEDFVSNGLGEAVVYSYSNVGFYTLTKTTQFDATKTVIFIGNNWGSDYGVNFAQVENDGTVSIGTVNMAGAPVNDRLQETSIEIRVYP